MNFEMSLDFDKISTTQLKRDMTANQVPYLLASNHLFNGYLVACSNKHGLFLLRVTKGKKLIVTKNFVFSPMKYTAFDATDKLTVLGTENGGIYVINNIDGSVIHSFTVNGYEYNNGQNSSPSSSSSTRARSNSSFVSSPNDNIPNQSSSPSLISSPSAIGNAISGFGSTLQNFDEIINLKIVQPNIVYWSTIDRFGGIDLSNSLISFYENRIFSSFVQLPVASCDEVIVVKRDRYAIGVNRIENLVLNEVGGVSCLEKPILFNSEVVAVCVQQKSSPRNNSKVR